MEIVIKIRDRVVEVSLVKSGVVIDGCCINQEYRLSEDLLLKIDDLLSRNGFGVSDISRLNLDSDMGDNFTTHRIALTTKNTFNWSLGVDN